MKTIRYGILVLSLVAICAVSQTSGSDRERLIGWHFVRMVLLPVGLWQHADRQRCRSHLSVQLMYPKSASALSNEYVLNGYEASFGSFEINQTTHTVTHRVQGSNTGDALVGKPLPRNYQFTPDGHLIIRSARPDEHWSVTWEHY